MDKSASHLKSVEVRDCPKLTRFDDQGTVDIQGGVTVHAKAWDLHT